jgi:hypothetical protein
MSLPRPFAAIQSGISGLVGSPSEWRARYDADDTLIVMATQPVMRCSKWALSQAEPRRDIVNADAGRWHRLVWR